MYLHSEEISGEATSLFSSGKLFTDSYSKVYENAEFRREIAIKVSTGLVF
jgi:hypothetical protein